MLPDPEAAGAGHGGLAAPGARVVVAGGDAAAQSATPAATAATSRPRLRNGLSSGRSGRGGGYMGPPETWGWFGIDARAEGRRPRVEKDGLWTGAGSGPAVESSWRGGAPGTASVGVVAPVTARKDRQPPPPTRRSPVPTPIDPTSAAFLLAENRNMPMHVGGLQLFEKPEGAGRSYTREMYESMRDVEEMRPLYLKHPHRSIRTAGQLVWKEDDQFDIEHHLRHSALPKPGRVRGAARSLRPAALDPPGVGAAAVGDPRHRGAARRPGRPVLQAPPRPGRRRLGDAAAPERADHRPRQARHARPLGRLRRLGAARSPRRTSTSPRCR